METLFTTGQNFVQGWTIYRAKYAVSHSSHLAPLANRLLTFSNTRLAERFLRIFKITISIKSTLMSTRLVLTFNKFSLPLASQWCLLRGKVHLSLSLLITHTSSSLALFFRWKIVISRECVAQRKMHFLPPLQAPSHPSGNCGRMEDARAREQRVQLNCIASVGR